MIGGAQSLMIRTVSIETTCAAPNVFEPKFGFLWYDNDILDFGPTILHNENTSQARWTGLGPTASSSKLYSF